MKFRILKSQYPKFGMKLILLWKMEVIQMRAAWLGYSRCHGADACFNWTGGGG
jgi:hypothetical protein